MPRESLLDTAAWGFVVALGAFGFAAACCATCGCSAPFSVEPERFVVLDAGDSGAPDVGLLENASGGEGGGKEAGGDAGGEEQATTVDGDPAEAAVEAGAPETSGDACSVTHSDGFGQTWTDCAPLATYDKDEGAAACAAYAAQNGGCAAP